jgi:hypothetical protein
MNHIPPIQGILQRQPFKRLPWARLAAAGAVSIIRRPDIYRPVDLIRFPDEWTDIKLFCLISTNF